MDKRFEKNVEIKLHVFVQSLASASIDVEIDWWKEELSQMRDYLSHIIRMHF